MWKKKSVAVILPTYNEKDSIAKIIQDYFATGYVDEVVVVNNNAASGTEEAVRETEARQIFENRQGYGYAIRKGINEVNSDLVIISEPDGTFRASDIIKLLAYSNDYDSVWGSRTDVRFIGEGANMNICLRFGNMLVAKMLQFIFNTSRLSDVGCTLKLYKKETLDKLKRHFTIGGEHFGVELMVLTAMGGFNIIEVPVNYNKRVGRSSVTGYPLKTFLLALKMIGVIMIYFTRRAVLKKKIFDKEALK